MSLEAALERVSAIRQALADPAALIGAGAGMTGGTQIPSAAGSMSTGTTSFAAELDKASGGVEGFVTESSAATALEDPSAAATSATGLPTATGLGGAGLIGPGGAASVYGLQSLGGVAGSSGLSPMGLTGQSSTGSRIVAIAESQLGQTEQPPGSNESPAIATYRSATADAIPGAPWCAYFASWVAREAGEPIGEGGQGAGAVSDVWSWAQSTGRAIPNGPGVVPKPGDLIVFGDEHVGIVRDVLPNGQIQTIEGNYENKVAANVRTPTEATGYVEMS
jgi:hypothetical protein